MPLHPFTFSAQEELLYTWLRSSLPSWLFEDAQEIPYAYVKMFALVADVCVWFDDMSFVQRSTGFWTDAHAKDIGTSRRNTEDDPELISRLMAAPQVISVANLEQAADEILGIHGGTTGARIVNVHQAYGTGVGVGMFLDYTPLDRGFRWGFNATPALREVTGFVMTLPYGTSDLAVEAVTEMLRKNAARGFARVVERREIP